MEWPSTAELERPRVAFGLEWPGKAQGNFWPSTAQEEEIKTKQLARQ